MRVFYSSLGLLILPLLVLVGCDYFGLTHSDTGPDVDPRLDPSLIAFSTADQQGLDGAIVEMYQAIQGHEIENPACITPSYTREDVGDLNNRLDDLLGQLGDGINRDNFYDSIRDIDSTAWARMDSVAMNVLVQDVEETLYGPEGADSPCAEADKELWEQTNIIFREHVDIIHSLGSAGFAARVEQVLSGYSADRCTRRCKKRYWLKSIGAIGGYTAAAAACTTISGGLAIGFCTGGAWALSATGIALFAMDLQDCLDACAKSQAGRKE